MTERNQLNKGCQLRQLVALENRQPVLLDSNLLSLVDSDA